MVVGDQAVSSTCKTAIGSSNDFKDSTHLLLPVENLIVILKISTSYSAILHAMDFPPQRFHVTGTPCKYYEDYRTGGFHPVMLDDVYSDRYRILRKLGYGVSSTVWLAEDVK